MTKRAFYLTIKLLLFSYLLAFQFSCNGYGQTAGEYLIVTAHPDDESAFAATIYKITHDLKGRVDIVVITNGEGGYKYSTLAESLYGVELTDEKVGREYLPTIRKQEMMNAGKLLGIRSYYFLEQKDHKYTQDVQEVFQSVWDVELVKKRLKEIISQHNYDYIFTLLPTADTHGHHKGATILALETVKNLTGVKHPIVLGATVTLKEDAEKSDFTGLEGFPVTAVKKSTPIFIFDRNQKFGFRDNLNYKIIANWDLAEHKSQGATQMGMGLGDIEKFYYFEINPETALPATAELFKQLKLITYKKRDY